MNHERLNKSSLSGCIKNCFGCRDWIEAKCTTDGCGFFLRGNVLVITQYPNTCPNHGTLFEVTAFDHQLRDSLAVIPEQDGN